MPRATHSIQKANPMYQLMVPVLRLKRFGKDIFSLSMCLPNQTSSTSEANVCRDPRSTDKGLQFVVHVCALFSSDGRDTIGLRVRQLVSACKSGEQIVVTQCLGNTE